VCHGSARLKLYGLRLPAPEVGGARSLHATQLDATGGAAHPIGVFSTGVRVDWGLSQRPARVDCGLSYATVQATVALASAIPACTIQTAN